MIVQNLIVKFQNFFKIDINPDRIFGLDLLRACAILFVVVGHSGNLIEWEKFKYVSFFILDGVSIFFVLSGFLIGKILIKAMIKNEISLKLIMKFWLKRWFRTMPNYFLILTVIVGLNLIYNTNFVIEDVYHYYFFSQNLWTIQPDFFPESWSLSIEEWFYILTPILLYLVIKGIRLPTKQAIIAVAILVIIFETFFRLYRFMNVDITNNDFLYSQLRSQVLTRFDSLMYGVIGSWLHVYYSKYWYKHKNIQFVIGLILFLFIKIEMVLFETFGLYDCVFSFSLTAVATLLVLPYLSSLKKGIGSISKYITVISLISYSMYLINYTLVLEWIIGKIDWTRFQNFNTYLSLICKISSFYIVTIVLSILIYKYFETPFMKLRDKIVTDASLNTLSSKKVKWRFSIIKNLNMFAVAVAQLKMHFGTLKNAVAVHPLFSCYDKYQLDQINRETNQKKHIRLEPKGWKYGITIRQNFVDKDIVFYALQEQYHIPSSQGVLSSKKLILDFYYHSKRFFFLLSFITNKPKKF